MEQLSLCTSAQELQQLSSHATATAAHMPGACAPQQEEPQQWEAHSPQLESGPYSLQLEKSLHSNKDPAQLKIN